MCFLSARKLIKTKRAEIFEEFKSEFLNRLSNKYHQHLEYRYL
jgi:hypothetical protein